jgi:hypothetical protein
MTKAKLDKEKSQGQDNKITEAYKQVKTANYELLKKLSNA